MKKYILYGISGLMLMNACNSDEFLGVKPRGKDVPSTLQHYDGLLNNQFMWNSENPDQLYFTLLSDEFYATPGSLDFLGMMTNGPQAGNAFRYMADIMRPDENCTDWAYNSVLYTYNMVANEVFDVSDGSHDERLAVQAEARVMRAWMHFIMAQIFCKPYNASTAATDPGLPVMKETDVTRKNFPRGTLQELYDFIISELEDACLNVSNATNSKYRTEKGDAYFFLGSVYYNMNRYDDALRALRLSLQYCTENNSLYLDDYTDAMNIMMLQMMGGMWRMYYQNEEYLRCLYAINTAVTYYIPIVELMLPAAVYMKPKYMALFGQGDGRVSRFAQGALDVDMRPAFPIETSLGATTPDLYTMIAECEARAGNASAARSTLLTLREKRISADLAEIPESVNTKDALIRFCIEERIREILGTGKLFFEMRRLYRDPLFADFIADFKHEVISDEDGSVLETYPLTEDRLTMRIPPEVMKWNDWENNK
ncbi:MAG: RagB/SusD family nutrient uptake outer membrane protein [Tannerella sp.]|nr:RagB/SusD family nutrient uptake outer membrane protein [Tannerella sp.]